MDPQSMSPHIQQIVRQELQQLEQPIRAEIQNLVQQGISHRDTHSAEVQNLRAELDNVRNQDEVSVHSRPSTCRRSCL